MIDTNHEIPSFGFTGHETFPFRHGWLHKGVMAVKYNSKVFSSDDAIVVLGVGKNMVRAIRHWCLALGLIKQDVDRGVYKITDLAELLFYANGADPYLEDIGTVWWLHWILARNVERCTTWYYVFNHLNRLEFTKSTLKKELGGLVKESGGRIPSVRTLDSDIECFLRTYTTPHRMVSEESLECPLVELGVLSEYGNMFRLNRSDKPTIPDHIFLAALVDFYVSTKTTAKTLSVERIFHADGSPGRIFLLDDNSCINRLQRLSNLSNGNVVYDSTAGLRQVLFNEVPSVEVVLQSYYQRG